MRTLLFDTETDGLSKNSMVRLEKQPSVIEFFGMTLEEPSMEEVGHWHSLFNHVKPLEDIIVKITKINNAMLADAPMFRTKAPELKAYIENHDRVVGHNLTFDIDRIDQ